MLEIFSLLVLLFSLVLHEISHGYVALALGDPTAKNEGRLSLNPLVHLDPFGSVLLPLFLWLVTAGRGPLFGWAKPVPINPWNFRDQKWGTLKVALAGPLANFGLALAFAFLLRFLAWPAAILPLLETIIIYNLMLGFFNLLPLPPLDGSQILFALLPPRLSQVRSFLEQSGPLWLIFFVFFGLQFLQVIVFMAFRFLVG
jgi:Zn-dependent protease